MLEGELDSKRKKVDLKLTLCFHRRRLHKLIELIKNEREVYHIGKADLSEND